ncbi:MAG: polyhydroxyalkanoate synthesis repressor PhaR [Salinarimonadaceae bacterium]|nr:MAG: polyhydroxyalkanoate synthesis repressor PhaR [Salinarimonadaceae bacterium]
MATEKQPIIIKKYANRRLYHTGASTYVTLEDLGVMVKAGDDFVVYDAKSGEDITRSVLTQIIFEQENKEGGQNLLPVAFLRQLIRFYGDSMQVMVPGYLENAMTIFAREQEKLREQMTQALAGKAFPTLDEQMRANMNLFGEAMKMFTPFATRPEADAAAAAEAESAQSEGAAGDGAKGDGAKAEGGKSGSDIDALKTQMAEMQARLDTLAKKR